MSTKSIARIAGAGICLALLTGCAQDPDERGEKSNRLSENTITLRDGRTVTCIIYAAGYKGGLSCDWDKASR